MASIAGTTISLDGIGHSLRTASYVCRYTNGPSLGPPKKIDELLGDLWESFRHGESEYFLGSVVLTGAHQMARKLLDGQQRLATVFDDLCRNSRCVDCPEGQGAGPFETQYLFSLNFKTEEIEPKLRLNEMDDGFFRAEVLAAKDGDKNQLQQPTRTRESERAFNK